MLEINYADDDMEDFKMPKKSRFSAPVSDDRMQEITKGSVPVAEHKEEHCMGG